MSEHVLKFGVIGAGGYWGPNWVRVLLQAGMLGAVCDRDSSRLQQVKARFGLGEKEIPSFSVPCNLLYLDLDGVFIVTPPASHALLAIPALERGKHVFIEKPLALSSEECTAIEEAAVLANRQVMVGHTFIFHPAVRKFKTLLPLVGTLRTISSVRANFGQYQTSGIILDLLPHDLSIFNYLLGCSPECVKAEESPCQDVAFVTCTYEGVTCSAYLSWSYPDKTRKLIAVGSTGILEWDLSTNHLLHHKKWCDPLVQGKFHHHDKGTETILVSDQSEPLMNELLHFAQCVRDNCAPIQGLPEGRAVVEGLVQCQ